MSKTKRYHNQIRILEEIFSVIRDKFLLSQPVDKALSNIFRRNKQIGSNDRRFISNAVFGYFRWYGWLKQLSNVKSGTAILLGYLLDGNKFDERIAYWAGQQGLPTEWLAQYDQLRADSLEKKAAVISSMVGPVSVSDLNPEFVGDWSIDRMNAFQSRPSIWVRIEQSDPHSFLTFLNSKNIAFRFHSHNPKTLEIFSSLNFNDSVDYRKGRVEIQDISSQVVGLICDPDETDVWWDVCSGSGGKALHLSALMGTRGLVYATEINADLNCELNRRVGKNRRWSNILPLRWNGLEPPKFDRKLDGVLVDAPCSCSGTWRRNPELRWQTTREQIKDYARVQLELLQLSCGSVRENGILVYATCSLFPEENEKVIESFLGLHREFSPEKIKNPFTNESSEKGLTIAPPQTDGNGMYVVRLKKRGKPV